MAPAPMTLRPEAANVAIILNKILVIDFIYPPIRTILIVTSLGTFSFEQDRFQQTVNQNQ